MYRFSWVPSVLRVCVSCTVCIRVQCCHYLLTAIIALLFLIFQSHVVFYDIVSTLTLVLHVGNVSYCLFVFVIVDGVVCFVVWR